MKKDLRLESSAAVMFEAAHPFDIAGAGHVFDAKALIGDPEALDGYLNRSLDIQDLIVHVGGLLRALGLASFAHYLGHCPADALDAIGTHMGPLRDGYIKNEFYLDDIAVSTSLEIDKPFFRSMVDDYILSSPFASAKVRNHKVCVEFLRTNGIFDAYMHPIVDGDHRAIFALSAEGCPAEIFQEQVKSNRDHISILALAFDRIGRDKYRSKFHGLNNNPNIILQPRVRQILQLMADKDLKQEEVARLLNIHTITVNKHMAAAKKALSTFTIHGTILAAKEAGLIS